MNGMEQVAAKLAEYATRQTGYIYQDETKVLLEASALLLRAAKIEAVVRAVLATTTSEDLVKEDTEDMSTWTWDCGCPFLGPHGPDCLLRRLCP